MVRAIPKQLGRLIWPLMVLTLVTLAIYVSGGRLLMGALPQMRYDIEQLLSDGVSGEVLIGGLSGTMDGFSPRLNLVDFSIRDEDTGNTIQLPAASIRLNPWQTLISGAPRFDELLLQSPRIQWTSLSGTDTAEVPQGVRDLLNRFQRLQIRDAQIIGFIGDDEARVILDSLALDIDLLRDGSRRVLRVTIEDADGQLLSAAGTGTGNPFEAGQFSGDVQGSLSGAGVAYLGRLFDVDLTAQGAADFWLTMSRGLAEGVVQADFTQLALTGDDTKSLETLRFDTAFAGSTSEASIWIDNAVVGVTERLFEAPRLELKRLNPGWRALTEGFEVQPLVEVMIKSGLFPDKANSILQTLNPRGRVDSLALTVESISDPLAGWAVQAEVTDATTDPYNQVPGLVGIDASLVASEEGATAWITTEDYALVLPNVYEEPIRLESVTGKLEGRWQPDALFLKNGLFLARATDHDATVQFEIDIPFSRGGAVPLEMRLAASVRDAPVTIRDAYVPYRMPDPAYRWLQAALPEGEIEEGIFLWRGGFRSYGDPGQTMQLAADLADVTLDYQPGWPESLQAVSQLRLDDTRIDIWSPESVIADVSMTAASVGILIDKGAAWLALRSDVEGRPDQILRTLQALPALSVADPVMNDLALSGEELANASLDMTFDLTNLQETVDITVAVDLMEAGVSSALLDLQAEHVSGRLAYQTQTGFESSGLTATSFGRQLKVEMGPHLATSANTLLAAQLDFEVSVSDLLSWQPLDFALPAQGVTSAKVAVSVADAVTVDIESDLQGIQIDLPMPWGKSDDARAPLKVSWHDREWAGWEVFWFGRFSAIADVPEYGDMAALVDLTPRTRPVSWPTLAPAPGVKVTGYLPSLDPADWLAQVGDWELGATSGSPPVHIEALRIERALWRGEELGSLELNLDIEGEAINARFDMAWLKGQFAQSRALPVSESAADLRLPLERSLTIEYIDLNELPEISEQFASQPPSEPSGASQEWLLPLPVSLASIQRGETALGGLALVVDYISSEGWVFRDITGEFLGIQWLPNTRIAWRSREEGADTHLTLAAELEDIATSLQLIGVTPIVETRSGRLDADWQWPGSPAEFELSSVTGVMNLDMQSGSFLSANAEATGALRLLSLLNLSGLFRRANMNQLFDPGVTFDRAGGAFEFNSGALHIPDFSIEGSGGYFTFSSDIDLIAETLNGELVVTLPLVENIPWVAALAGGLPVAAGTYLIGKVFEDQMNQLSSGVYAVSGDLEDPQVSFERVFDATSRLPETESQDVSESGLSSPDK